MYFNILHFTLFLQISKGVEELYVNCPVSVTSVARLCIFIGHLDLLDLEHTFIEEENMPIV